MQTVKVFVSHEAHPTEDCAGATVVVAAASRMNAVSALRSAGFSGRHLKTAPSGSIEESAALREPGAVLWADWPADTDAQWHRR